MDKIRPYLFYKMVDEYTNLPLFIGVNNSLTEFLESVNACFSRFLEKDGIVRSYEVVGKVEDKSGSVIKVDIYDSYIDRPEQRFPALNTEVTIQEFILGNVVEL